jgi:hypothetical protein
VEAALVFADQITIGGDGTPNDPLAAILAGILPSFADAEIPVGAIDGLNLVFTLAFAPSPAASLQLFQNGLLTQAGGVDYTLAGLTITFGIAPVGGDTLVAYYRH